MNTQLNETQQESEIQKQLKLEVVDVKALQASRKEQVGILKEFLLTKKIEGCSAATLQNYHDRILKLILWSTTDVRELTAKDLRQYLYEYQEVHEVSRSTLDGMRLVFSSFYAFLEEEDHIIKSPMRKIHKIRSEEIIRKPFTDEEFERIRKSAGNIRDLAIIDLLYSSGCRISELVGMNISDVDFKEREVIVRGKGAKERICYFNARTKLELVDYLTTRADKEPALFVKLREPSNRIASGTVQRMLKRIEKSENIPDVHPHRFRRTLATNLLNKGMTLEQVQAILGHKRIETTLIYTTINQDSVKIAHQKYTF